MNHKHVQLLLDAYIDNEIDPVNTIEIEEHLESCSMCSQRYAELKALRSTIAGAEFFSPAPSGLEGKIKLAIRESADVPRRMPSFQWRWLALAVVLVGILILGAGALSGWFAPNQENALALEIQSAHIRSLLANHLTDIPSTDQHTVKPWFAGKLDFSPPIVDLADQGYALIGGRLDYLNNRSVAALIYQHDKHFINVFIWPTAERSGTTASQVINGYNLAHWDQAGMTFWAVSDLNMNELESFVQLIRKNIT